MNGGVVHDVRPTDTYVNMITSHSNNATAHAKAVRDEYKEYFMSELGSVQWLSKSKDSVALLMPYIPLHSPFLTVAHKYWKPIKGAVPTMPISRRNLMIVNIHVSHFVKSTCAPCTPVVLHIHIVY